MTSVARRRIETRATVGELWNKEPLSEGEPTRLVIGGVSYDGGDPGSTVAMAGTTTGAPSTLPVQVASILRGGAWSGGFTELPATTVEVAGVAAAFGTQASVTLLDQGDARRERMLELAPRTRCLHVATHGWFARESIPSWSDLEPLDEESGLAMRQRGDLQVKATSPMLLCGLALAGADLPEDDVGRAPGLVRAEDLAALDLTDAFVVAEATHVR